VNEHRRPTRLYGRFPELHFEQLHTHDDPLPEFPALRHVHESIALPGHALQAHTHAEFEICYFLSGQAHWFSGDRKFELKAGDIYITHPGDIHGGNTDPRDPQHLFDIALDVYALPNAALLAPAARRLKSEPAGDAKEVADAVVETRELERNAGTQIIPGGFGLERIYRQILHELDLPAESGSQNHFLKIAMVQALLVELLVFVSRCRMRMGMGEAGAGPNAPRREKFQELIAAIRARPEQAPSLTEMSEFAGLTPAYFAALFKKQTGMTPLEFVTFVRIEEAAARLRSGKSVTDVALDLGFSSPQYFSIVFKRQKGCAPSEWRAAHST